MKLSDTEINRNSKEKSRIRGQRQYQCEKLTATIAAAAAVAATVVAGGGQ
jgi:hypothetical protein